jgi:nucleotide-binding universal stress UspA family protein
VLERVLVGTDGSPTAGHAVDRAVEVAAAFGAGLTILMAGRRADARDVVGAEAERHRDAVITIDTRVDERDPATALLDTAEEGDYDLLVVGNRGMTGAGRSFLGSVPTKVSHHASRSLLIVRTT